ncbi:fimbrial biogenesis chaperone [Rhodanobacter sp. BL-MT-08]
MKRHPASSIACVVFAAWSALATQAVNAATFSINPTRVELDAKHRADIITVYNSSDAALRLQVRSMRWQMQADGKWKLDPSDDLIVTPELVEVAPGKSVELRVGSLQVVDATEASYRLLLNELPGLANDPSAKTGQIRVLTEINLPVFIEPEHAERKPVIRTGSVDHGLLTIGIGNDGNQRLDPQSVLVSVLDRAGNTVLQKDLVANYVLAGSTGTLELKLARDVCSKAASVSLTWSGTLAQTLRHSITANGTEACESTSSN